MDHTGPRRRGDDNGQENRIRARKEEGAMETRKDTRDGGGGGKKGRKHAACDGGLGNSFLYIDM